MKPMILNDDDNHLTLETDFVKHEIASNHSKEENIKAYFRNKDLFNANSSLCFPNFALNDRKIL